MSDQAIELLSQALAADLAPPPAPTPAAPDDRLRGLLRRIGLRQSDLPINEVRLQSALHDRHFTPAERNELSAGLRRLNLLEARI